MTCQGPVLTEEPDGGRTWIVRWFCAPPPPGTRFRVRREEWHDEPRPGGAVPCRDILAVTIPGAGVPGAA